MGGIIISRDIQTTREKNIPKSQGFMRLVNDVRNILPEISSLERSHYKIQMIKRVGKSLQDRERLKEGEYDYFKSKKKVIDLYLRI